MTSLPTVLIFTYPEYGQANVALATSYELALAGVDVYIASFASLETRISRLQQLIVRNTSSHNPTGSVFFRECGGFTPFDQALAKCGITPASIRHPHNVSGALGSYSKLAFFMHPWGQEEHLVAIESCKEIIATIKPNMVVIDLSFYPPMDACDLLDQKFMVLLPNSILDVAASVQPYLAALWKYPIISSGFPFPLKWWQIPLNIYLSIRLVIYLMTSVRRKQIRALRSSLGVRSTIGDPLRHGAIYICPALPETDFSSVVIPEEMRLCGPIIIPFDPLEKSDPALMTWLGNGPTVMINLGSHIVSDKNIAREVAGAIRILLNHHDERRASKMQVLWKAKGSESIDEVIDEVIGKEIKEGRVKVLPWLDAEPVSILQHPNVVCTVHHGGANSFYEGIWSGLPHIVLSVWLDTYQYASRVEFLKIGVFGNRKCAPEVQAEEFGKALVRVTGDTEEAVVFKTAAKQLKEVCKAKGNGRQLSSLVILKEAGIRK